MNAPATRTIHVGTHRPYDVIVGAQVLDGLAPLFASRRRVAIVTQSAIRAHAETLAKPLLGAGVSVDVIEIADGEDAKALATVEQLTRRFASTGMLRADLVVALGGGVVGDVAGFAAAVYHRGVDLVQAPTTLLAMVDSSIGGKTAVNLPEGKNLVGAFHQPVVVVSDVATLATLPERELRCGLGEVAKYALMGGPSDPDGLAALVTARADEVLARDQEVLSDLVARCASIKAAVVAADEEERTGVRATLNYGHTFAHALETVDGHTYGHGEAVAVGLAFAGALAGAMERIDAAEVERQRTLVASLGLPTTAASDAPVSAFVDVMRRDKKAAGGLTFILPGPGGLERVDDPPGAALDVAFAAVGVGG